MEKTSPLIPESSPKLDASNCQFCGTHKATVRAKPNYAGCSACNSFFRGKLQSAVEYVDRELTEEERADWKRWRAAKEEKHGSLEAFYATGKFSEEFKLAIEEYTK